MTRLRLGVVLKRTIRSVGAVAFANGGSNVVPFSGRRTAQSRPPLDGADAAVAAHIAEIRRSCRKLHLFRKVWPHVKRAKLAS